MLYSQTDKAIYYSTCLFERVSCNNNKIKVFQVMIQFVIVYTAAYPPVAGLDLST